MLEFKKERNKKLCPGRTRARAIALIEHTRARKPLRLVCSSKSTGC
jgi:hypothetical protein